MGYKKYKIGSETYVEVPESLRDRPYCVPAMDPILRNRCIVVGGRTLLPSRLAHLLPKSGVVAAVSKALGVRHINLRLWDIYR